MGRVLFNPPLDVSWRVKDNPPYASCNASDAGCSASSAFGGLLRNAYPGQPSGTIVEDGGRYTVTPAGPNAPMPVGQPVVTTVDYDNLSITNTTASDHIFCCGYATRSIVQDGSNIYVNTYGSGTNSSEMIAVVNHVMGLFVFSAADDGIRQYVQQQGRWSSYSPNSNPDAPPPPR